MNDPYLRAAAKFPAVRTQALDRRGKRRGGPQPQPEPKPKPKAPKESQPKAGSGAGKLG